MDRWVFVHIMKTAGTSFRTMLEETPGVALFPTREELALHPRRWYPPVGELLGRIERGELDLSERRFLCGHYPAALADRLPGSWRTLTFLRDPVRRSLSMIAHRNAKATRLNRVIKLHRFIKPNISRFLDDQEFVDRQIRDYQTKVFALDGAANVNAAHSIDAAAFDRAKARLLATDFVGLTEQFAESVRLLESMTGTKFAQPPHANRSRGYAASDAEIARIRALVPHDLELYEIAREKLRAQVAPAA